MKFKSLLFAFLLPVTFASAQSCLKDFAADPYLAGSNYVAYPGPKSTLTPAPAGYEPCYISHYGRHGSRYHIGKVYDEVYNMLLRADRARMLTERGKQLLDEARQIREEAAGRDGELTELGAQQSAGIAERMFNNFPEVFKKPNTHIDAKSTVVIRCILTMESALQQLKSMNPALDIRHDASHHDMYYMNHEDRYLSDLRHKGTKSIDAFYKEHSHPERLMNLIFSKQTFWKDSINADKTMRNIFKLAMNLQSSELRHKLNLCGLFTQEELYDLWQQQNANWYISYGPSNLSGGVQPYSQATLLRKIIEEADSCLRLENCGVNLRYGHDTMVMPLTCLLELNNSAKDISDLNTLPTHEWCDYRIFPMGCNLQFVFYRSKGAKAGTSVKDSKGRWTMVKVLSNENEARLPIKTDSYPYYKWSDVKEYYLRKLDKYEASRKANAK